jgi:DNA (cytosine-5)-methyltransferase 1
MLKIGSLCTGYGGLDMAVEAYFDAEMVWCAENDKYASQVIKKRFNKPNYGDIKTIKLDQVEPIDVLTAGYPCQPFSTAGSRKGKEDERHLWPYIKEIISILRPQFIVLENVTGHLNYGFNTVLGDLTEIGYDAKWKIVRASDVGAPHHRARLFVIAYPIGSRWSEVLPSGFTKKDTNSKNISFTSNSTSTGLQRHGSKARRYRSSSYISKEAIPPTLDQFGRLNPLFVEYMMGLPLGWVTDLGLSRMQQLKMLGNGVVPQQAYRALELLHDSPSDLRL